jgi:hypothetical protein
MTTLKKKKRTDLLYSRAREKINQLYQIPGKPEKCAKLILAIENSLKFWKLRNKDKESESIVEQYLVKAQLFLEKCNESERESKTKKSKGKTTKEG